MSVWGLVQADDSHIFCRKVDKKREKAGKSNLWCTLSLISVGKDYHIIINSLPIGSCL